MSIKLCSKSDIPDGTAKRFDVEKHRIAVVRIGEDFYAIGDRCSHADFSLAEGDVYTKEKAVECWKHGSLFSVETGEALNLPATQPVPVYEIEIRGDDVCVSVPEGATK